MARLADVSAARRGRPAGLSVGGGGDDRKRASLSPKRSPGKAAPARSPARTGARRGRGRAMRRVPADSAESLIEASARAETTGAASRSPLAHRSQSASPAKKGRDAPTHVRGTPSPLGRHALSHLGKNVSPSKGDARRGAARQSDASVGRLSASPASRALGAVPEGTPHVFRLGPRAYRALGATEDTLSSDYDASDAFSHSSEDDSALLSDDASDLSSFNLSSSDSAEYERQKSKRRRALYDGWSVRRDERHAGGERDRALYRGDSLAARVLERYKRARREMRRLRTELERSRRRAGDGRVRTLVVREEGRPKKKRFAAPGEKLVGATKLRSAARYLADTAQGAVICETASYGRDDDRRLRRVPWSAAEEECLLHAYARHPGKWRAILDENRAHFAPGRTPGDLKDKWRNLAGGRTYGDRRPRDYVLLDADHRPIRTKAGRPVVYRNRWPRDAALKAACAPEAYGSPEETATVVRVREALPPGAADDPALPPVVHVFEARRALEDAPPHLRALGVSSVWVPRVSKVCEERRIARDTVERTPALAAERCVETRP